MTDSQGKRPKPKDGESNEVLASKVKNWLSKEGYPLEFRTAHIFRKAGFDVLQGFYVHGPDKDSVREVDILASVAYVDSVPAIRICYLVECKWTIDRPWVIFTSPESATTPTASIGETMIPSEWKAVISEAATIKSLAALETYSSPIRTGFGGRVAFSKGQDNFYQSVQSILFKAAAHINFWKNRGHIKPPIYALIDLVFPMIVIDGPLFEAFHDENADGIEMIPVSSSRLHWRGSDDWSSMVQLDIVKIEGLQEFAERRFAESEHMIEALRPIVDRLK
jgi:hypothetical protein